MMKMNGGHAEWKTFHVPNLFSQREKEKFLERLCARTYSVRSEAIAQRHTLT